MNKIERIRRKQTLTLEDQPYCYYPLHIKPEDSLSVCAPELNNQVAAIDLLAISLPARVILVVKEHFIGCTADSKAFLSS